MPPATAQAQQSIVKQSEDAARLAELFAVTSPLPDQQLVEITCPTSARPGQHIEAQTASGRIHVTIPDGVSPGQTFLVRPAPAVGKAHAEVADYHRVSGNSTESQYHSRLAEGALLLGQDKFNEAAKAFEAACKLKPDCGLRKSGHGPATRLRKERLQPSHRCSSPATAAAAQPAQVHDT